MSGAATTLADRELPADAASVARMWVAAAYATIFDAPARIGHLRSAEFLTATSSRGSDPRRPRWTTSATSWCTSGCSTWLAAAEASNRTLARSAHVETTLAAVGWAVDPDSVDDPLCDTQRVASELQVAPRTARRWMREAP
jgi:hypothetical protein